MDVLSSREIAIVSGNNLKQDILLEKGITSIYILMEWHWNHINNKIFKDAIIPPKILTIMHTHTHAQHKLYTSLSPLKFWSLCKGSTLNILTIDYSIISFA